MVYGSKESWSAISFFAPYINLHWLLIIQNNTLFSFGSRITGDILLSHFTFIIPFIILPTIRNKAGSHVIIHGLRLVLLDTLSLHPNQLLSHEQVDEALLHSLR